MHSHFGAANATSEPVESEMNAFQIISNDTLSYGKISTNSDSQPSQNATGLTSSKRHVKLPEAKFGLRQALLLDIRQGYREIKRNLSQYFIGCFSIFFVVFIVALMMTVLSYAPVLFLGVSESYYGPSDLVLTASANALAIGLNYTAINETMTAASQRLGLSQEKSQQYSSHAPRYFELYSSLSKAADCPYWDPNNPTDSHVFYNGPDISANDSPAVQRQKNETRRKCHDNYRDCAFYTCGRQTTINTGLTLLNTDLEQTIGMGRSWPYTTPPIGSAIIQDSYAYTLDVEVGDYVMLYFDFWAHFVGVFQQVSDNLAQYNISINPDFLQLMQVVAYPVKVSAILKQAGNGKFGIFNGETIVMDIETFLEGVSTAFHPEIPAEFRQNLTAMSKSLIYQYPTHVYFALPAPRTNWYLNSNFGDMATKISIWASDIIFRVGFDMVSAEMPLLRDLKASETVSSMLSLILSLTVLVLSTLSIFLVYSLLMVSIETRTFELGVFRMVGMTRAGLIQFLLVQALGYAIPAWVAGLTLAQVAFIPLRVVCENIFGIAVSPFLKLGGILMSTGLGLISPLISAILPIREALSHNLHDALDTRRGRSKAIAITVERSIGTSGSPILHLTGLVLTVFGFGAYYFIPYSLVTQNTPLFFNLLLSVMVAMILGLVIASLNVQPLLERVTVFLLFNILRFENMAVPILVIKNLTAHRLRNRKTTIMYALSLGFIIFITVFVQVELGSLSYNLERRMGTNFQVLASAYNPDGTAAGIRRMDDLEALAENEPLIAGYAWITYALDELINDLPSASISNPGRIANFQQKVYGISSNLFDIADPKFIKTSFVDQALVDSYTASLSQQLYSLKGSRSGILGTYYREPLQLLSDNFTDLMLVNSAVSDDELEDDPAKAALPSLLYPLAFAYSLPYFTTSARLTGRQDLIVSLPQYVALSRGLVTSVRDIPFNKMMIRFAANATSNDIRRIAKSFNKILSFERMDDLGKQIEGYTLASFILAYVFDGITLIVMMIAFFSLNTSMYVNVVEQSKEIGIFRALGTRKAAIYRLYIYEAFILTFSSGLLGVAIGVVVGGTISAQRAVITEIPVGFQFPTSLLIIVFLASAFCAVLSTASPVSRLLNKKLVSLLRD